jgi:hypothetical protein
MWNLNRGSFLAAGQGSARPACGAALVCNPVATGASTIMRLGAQDRKICENRLRIVKGDRQSAMAERRLGISLVAVVTIIGHPHISTK